MLGMALALATAVDPQELSNHAAVASDFLSTANMMARFVYSGMTKGYQAYRFVRDTSPINTVAVVVVTIVLVYAAVELVRMLFRELFGLKRSYTADISESSEVRDLN